MTYEIAIPSYNRVETLMKATLPTLERYKADPKKVTIFVANDEQYAMYKNSIPQKYKLVVGELGLLEVKKFYHSHYDLGTRLFNIQDDIYDLKEKNDDKLKPMSGTLDNLVELGFEVAEAVGAKMWGLNPTGNPMFMQNNISVGLRFIYGAIYGDYAGNPSVVNERILDLPSGEDWENTISSYLRNGCVARIEWISPKSKLFAKGGMEDYLDSIGDTRENDHEKHLNAIANHYPELVTTYRKAGDVLNLRLKPMKTTRIPKEEITEMRRK